jgi:hypothetical protein
MISQSLLFLFNQQIILYSNTINLAKFIAKLQILHLMYQPLFPPGGVAILAIATYHIFASFYYNY